jgi:colanic acid biosynthesis glycosyl transferase WcaI
MKILIFSQVFWPDSSAVSQHLTDLALELMKRKNDISILSSRYDYENPNISFKSNEFYNNIKIKRIKQSKFNKKSIIGRLINFIFFNLFLSFELFKLNKNDFDVIIGTTVPPLSSFLGAFFSKIKKIPFCFWAMDIQPELSIVAGYIKEKSIITKILYKIGIYIIKNSKLIIALDKYMAEYIVKKCGNNQNIKIIPVWPIMNEVYSGKRLDNPFRKQNNFNNKIVIMYSGNHAVVHPLNTILEAAKLLRYDDRFLFVFIGGGVRKEDVVKFNEENKLRNIISLPYQNRDNIHLSLGSADIHIVIHGNGCTGFTHPSKIYGAMFIGKPILYVGPSQSHITDILDNINGNILVKHGEVDILVKKLIYFSKNDEIEWNKIGMKNMEYVRKNLMPDKLINDIIVNIENINYK